MSKKCHKRDLVAYLKIAMLVILQNDVWTIYFHEKVIIITNYKTQDDGNRELRLIHKRQVVCSFCRTFIDFERNVVIKMILSTHLLLKLGFR